MRGAYLVAITRGGLETSLGEARGFIATTTVDVMGV